MYRVDFQPLRSATPISVGWSPRGRRIFFSRPALISNTYAGTMVLTPTGLSTSSRRYDCCEGLSSSTRRRVATLRRSGSKTCPASPHPIRRPHAIIFRPFRSSPNSSTMHFMQFPFYRPSAVTCSMQTSCGCFNSRRNALLSNTHSSNHW